MEELGHRGHSLSTGIYFGYARLGGNIYETVVSVGWNPYYKNERKTIEAHLLARMEDFYGEKLDVLLLGYLRDEMNFESLGAFSYLLSFHLFRMVISQHSFILFANLPDALISCINADIARSRDRLKDLIHHMEADWEIHET
jgi:hypothetical protein